MERPQSQLENVRPSGLKPPSRLPALSGNIANASRTLQETSSSDLNARTATASGNGNGNGNGPAAAPTNAYAYGIVPSKHKVYGLPEPPAKRKTLAERAAEPVRSHIPSKSSISSGFGSRPKTNIDYYRNPANTAISSSTNGIRPNSRQANALPRYPAPRAVKSSLNLQAHAQHDDQESDGETSVMGRRDAFDTNLRLDSMEKMFNSLKNEMAKVNHSKEAIETSLELYKTQAAELQAEKRDLASQCKSLSSDLERTRTELHTTSTDLRQVRRDHERELHDLERKHDKELSDLRLKQEREDGRVEREREREADRFRREMEEAQSAWEKEKDREISDMTTQHWDELDQIKTAHEKELSDLRAKVHELEEAGESRATESASEVQLLRDIVASTQSQLDASNATIASLRSRITTFEARISTLEQEKNSLVSKAHFLEGNQEAQSQEFTVMQQKLEEAIAAKEATVETLRKEEALRRKLNAMILELRGNIRVFVRTRPLLNGEDDPAKVEYLDQDSLEGCKEMIVHAPTTQTATGKQRNEKHQYDFDRVFTPGTSNPTVFEECRDLIQSVVDGYNVSILSYGQTGSGKTYGMTGPEGIIPSSIRMLLSEMGRLREKGWEYAVEANFVEVYNETLNDLLGDAKTWDDTDDVGASVRGKKKEKHEIHHDAATGKTTVTNLTTVGLWPPPNDDGNWPPPAPVDTDGELTVSYTEKAVTNLLDTAAKNRRVAATKANERSSRSHSIFMLTLKGSCPASGEHSEGVLNLVDLAGSERLKQSGAEGSRMKETQAINKSLSSLGDVIAALGTKSGNSEAHVPYRNSKLTYLLQSSLGGTTAGKSSRTLMLLHLSPLQAHWQESRSSLLFGSKVHGTHIGTAKKR